MNNQLVITLTDAKFVLENPQPVVVYFSADWSGSANIVSLIVDDLAGRFSGKATFVTVDFDRQRQLAQRMGVASIPTLLLFCNGRAVDKVEGMISRSELAERIEAHLGEAPAHESSAEATGGIRR